MPWTDGIRDITRIHATTSEEAIQWLEAWRRNNAQRDRPLGYMVDEVSLDHDLGGDDTGMKVLNWMIEHEVWPQELTIHTSNPPARRQMLTAANAEAPEWVTISVIYDHLKKDDSE
ncbi:hypothetical protein SEA_BIG4_161 [Microbacterium phage Big4]|nr:hypothetical protein SEA_BIG4_161 [Microbacterium phage Big4]